MKRKKMKITENVNTYQKKMSKIAFFAKRGDFTRSNMVALSVRMSDAVKFLCKDGKRRTIR